MIEDREFRSGSYYRLHVFPIRVPPLRDRKEDILQLVSYFVRKFAKHMQKEIDSISPIVMKAQFLLDSWCPMEYTRSYADGCRDTYLASANELSSDEERTDIVALVAATQNVET